MEQFTREQVDEMLREAIDRTEKSFGGTFKRLKAENEEMQARHEAERAHFTEERESLEESIAGFQRELSERRAKEGEQAVREEIRRQLDGGSPLPERFIPVSEIEYGEDPEALAAAVAAALEKGRREFEETLREAGISLNPEPGAPVNPTNPPGRGGVTVREQKTEAAKEALKDMARRGMIR